MHHIMVVHLDGQISILHAVSAMFEMLIFHHHSHQTSKATDTNFHSSHISWDLQIHSWFVEN